MENGHRIIRVSIWLIVLYRAGDRIRTGECQLGRLMPYHLATPATDYDFTVMRVCGQVDFVGNRLVHSSRMDQSLYMNETMSAES